MASGPRTANHVQDALLTAFTSLCDALCNKPATAAYKVGYGGYSAQKQAQHACMLSALAPALAVGGALDALFLRKIAGEDAKYAATSLRDDVMHAFLCACDSVLSADAGHMRLLSELMRTRMLKALWEVLAPKVRVLAG